MSQDKFMCHTPFDHCSGTRQTLSTTNKGLRSPHLPKTHSTGQEANACYGRYLVSQGYRQLTPRTYQRGDEPVLVLSKAKRRPDLRKGKQYNGNRVMTAQR